MNTTRNYKNVVKCDKRPRTSNMKTDLKKYKSAPIWEKLEKRSEKSKT